MKASVCFALLALSLGTAAHAADTTRDTQDKAAPATQKAYLVNDDRQFVEKAARAGNAEVALSQLAVRRAQNDAVKRYAQQMIKDHTAANKDLPGLAKPLGLTVPTDLDDDHRKSADDLAKLKGTEFDAAYMKQMVADHEQAVTLFSEQSAAGKDEKLRAWSGKMLPHLQDHLNLARELHNSIK